MRLSGGCENNPSYDTAFRRAYGQPADTNSLTAAPVAFQETLVFDESRFDRFYLGGDSTALTSSEQRGWVLFRRSGCDGCHTPLPDPNGSGVIVFSDNRFHNLGVGYADGRMEDAGRYEATGDPSDWGAFRTPSLHNIAMTDPYMHDGSLATLEEVVGFYVQGGIQNPNLDGVMVPRKFTDQEQADLTAFLRALTTEWLADSALVRRRLMCTNGQSEVCEIVQDTRIGEAD